MSRHVAMLRGINVAGKNRLPMADLVAMFTAAGCTDVTSYIQSGNVVFSAPAKTVRTIGETISAAIARDFELRVPLVLRTAAELADTVANNPFGPDTSPLHVMFLADRPTAARVAALDPARSPGDRFTVVGRDVYLFCPNGVGNTKLSNAWFDSKLATTSTGRNWNTVLRLLALCDR